MASRFVLASSLLVLVAACDDSGSPQATQDAFEVENPSGDCETPDNGDRAGYHASAGTVWVPDCQNPLAREYWRVFAVDSEHAAMIPRPDGAEGLAPACADAGHPLHAIVERYGLCHAAASSAEVELVNAMAIGDALQVARELQRQLRFTHRGDLAPFAPPTDILDACALRPQESAALREMCEREQKRLESGNDIGFDYAGIGGVELAQRLNEIYGIPASGALDCVQYADGVCDAAAQCSSWSIERVACGATCDDPGSETRSYCVRGGTTAVTCLAERRSGDLYVARGGGAVADPENWRDCTESEQTTFGAATR